MELEHHMQTSPKTDSSAVVISIANNCNLQDHTSSFPNTMTKAATQAQALAEQILNQFGSSCS